MRPLYVMLALTPVLLIVVVKGWYITQFL